MVENASDPNGAATQTQLNAWITSRKIAFPMAIDPPDAPLSIKTILGTPRETAYVVDLDTMEILYKGMYTGALTKINSL